MVSPYESGPEIVDVHQQSVENRLKLAERDLRVCCFRRAETGKEEVAHDGRVR